MPSNKQESLPWILVALSTIGCVGGSPPALNSPVDQQPALEELAAEEAREAKHQDAEDKRSQEEELAQQEDEAARNAEEVIRQDRRLSAAECDSLLAATREALHPFSLDELIAPERSPTSILNQELVIMGSREESMSKLRRVGDQITGAVTVFRIWHDNGIASVSVRYKIGPLTLDDLMRGDSGERVVTFLGATLDSPIGFRKLIFAKGRAPHRTYVLDPSHGWHWIY